jgi:phospholipase C
MIEHVFVVMLENRSFDHMLGFSKIQGLDAVDGHATEIDGLSGNESNPSPAGGSVRVSSDAEFVMNGDPGHEFENVRLQLCGKGRAYSSPSPPLGKIDPNITNSGYVEDYGSKDPRSPGEVMRCFSAINLPVLTTLAKEFAICDHWFSSMPGPTWPNRFFLHAASAAGLDHSPPKPNELGAMLSIDGYWFEHGTIFDRLDQKGIEWAIYHGDEFPQVLAIKGMIAKMEHFHWFNEFDKDVADSSYSNAYTFIEPSWHGLNHFRCGNSQHPMDDVTRGERLLKQIYQSIRKSPHWKTSLLIITYDEHGGFYDHVAPPTAVAPGDRVTEAENNRYNFNFQQLGVRVPTVIVSPFIPKGTIDHRVYDHTSVLSTIEALFDLKSLTARDEAAPRVNGLLSLTNPRTDAPETLPDPPESGFSCNPIKEFVWWLQSQISDRSQTIDPAITGFVHIALLRELHNSPEKRDQLIRRFRHMNTKLDAVTYLRRVRTRV